MIVPIIGIHKGKMQQIATAFIIEPDILITAGHAFYDENRIRLNTSFKIIINNRIINLKNVIYENYPKLLCEYSKHEDNYEDIIIFRLSRFIKSNLHLSTNYFYEAPVELVGFKNCGLEQPEYNHGQIINHILSATNITRFKVIIDSFQIA